MSDNFDKPCKYGAWKVKELREELGKRGAKRDGKKTDLIDRLECYDRNQDFGRSCEVERNAYEMKTPDVTHYKDLNTDMALPDVSMETTIDGYLHPLNKTLGKESINLVNERFLLFIRVCVDENIYFIKSQCRAEMKKSVIYNIDVSVDRHAVVQECQCDCGAGMGPEAHCKHVNAVLYALFLFCIKGNVITEKTCTQKLQTFHRVKTHKGSPVKAKSLTLPYRNTERAAKLQFDPRPVKYQNSDGYPDHFRNTCLQFANIGSLPISQLFQPANMYAFSSDHDYFAMHPVDKFLEVINVTKISSETAAHIEESTRGQSSNKMWFSERCIRLPSSMYGKICKVKNDLEQKDIDRDDTFINNMVSSLRSFFEKHFKRCLLEKHYYKQYYKYF